MSILLTRLLERAEPAFRAGDPAEAESLCFQVIRGAAAVKNVPLMIDAARLLGRIPDTGSLDRENSFIAILNYIAAQQQNPDATQALAVCDMWIEALEEINPDFRLRAFEVALFIARNNGRDRKKYLEGLAKSLGAGTVGTQGRALPESTLTEGPAVAADILTMRGCVLVRGVLDPAVLESVRQEADILFSKAPIQVVALAELANYGQIISDEAHSFLCAVLQPFLMNTPALQPDLGYVRQVSCSIVGTTVPFHQDMNAFGRVLVNCWAPLTSCGVTAPGLEVVAMRLDEIADTIPATDQYDDLQISQDLIAERYGTDAFFRPEMNPGDILLLLGTTIHRTHMTPAMKERRTSLELRFG